jgi:hypothetical protein
MTTCFTYWIWAAFVIVNSHISQKTCSCFAFVLYGNCGAEFCSVFENCPREGGGKLVRRPLWSIAPPRPLLVGLKSQKGLRIGWCGAALTRAPPPFPVLRSSSWMNINFRIPGTLLEPSAMGRLAVEQEPDEKLCLHAPSIHGGVFKCWAGIKTTFRYHLSILIWTARGTTFSDTTD